MQNQTRREFFKKASLVAMALPFLNLASGSWTVWAKGKEKKAGTATGRASCRI